MKPWVVFVLVLSLTLGNADNGVCSCNCDNLKLQLKMEIFPNRPNPSAICGSFFSPDNQEHQNRIDEIIDKELTNSSSSEILQYISKQSDNYLYHGFMKIYKAIKQKKLNDYVLMDLAFHINEAKERGHVASLLNLFPPSLRALISSLNVCVKNKGYGEYFYAGANDLKYDFERRNVFTWIPLGEAGRQGDWEFKHIQGNEFYINNLQYHESLYAEGASFNLNDKRRRVFTKKSFDGSSGYIWSVEFYNNDVFIRNVKYGEYLYVLDMAKNDNNRRSVLTWIPESSESCDSETYQCRWSLSNC